jgi:neopullulanase
MKISSTILFTLTILLFSGQIMAQRGKSIPAVDQVYPPNWWTGMAGDTLQLIMHGNNIQQYKLSLESPHSRIVRVSLPPNKNYLIANVVMTKEQLPGKLVFVLSGIKKKRIEYHYPILARKNQGGANGIDASDLIYLVFPDRFANGDPTNDNIAGMKEAGSDRKGLKTRHGGDIQGILDHLDYFEELGTTALWINPLLENDQPYESYHGYAATDLYKIDPRFGTNELYKTLVEKCHERGIKMIWDVVYNHWGNENDLFVDLPDSSWVHWFPEFTRTSYRAEVLMDPYASETDKKIMTDAWFDKHMPDLNQQNPDLAKFLIQNSIWWIEYAGIDAFRIDTYAYPDQHFMKKLNESIRKEYPEFVLFGETWVQGTPVQGWFTEQVCFNKAYSSSLQGVTDFQLYYAITKGLTENFGWEEGFRRIELTLAQDVIYNNPNMLVTFLDNHDLSRYYSMMNENMENYKMGIALLYTLRGIPSIYYGTEILMKNYADPDAKVREDFPGGWPGDEVNKFVVAGRNEKEKEAFELCKKLGQWRKANPWIGKADLKQFVPNDDTYVYFRMYDQKMLMCVFNGNNEQKILDTRRFTECIKDASIGRDIISGMKINIGNSLTIGPNSFLLIELER